MQTAHCGTRVVGMLPLGLDEPNKKGQELRVFLFILSRKPLLSII